MPMLLWRYREWGNLFLVVNTIINLIGNLKGENECWLKGLLLEELTSLNRSWNFAPPIIAKSGCTALNYNKAEKAYYLIRKEMGTMKFQIPASKESPLENPAFVIKNFDGNIRNIEVEINNGRAEFKRGIELDTEGKKNLVIWIPYSSASKTSFKIFSK